MSDVNGKAIGLRIRKLREARGQSINDLADAIGIGRGSIWSLEAGRVVNPGIETVLKAASYFRVRIDEVLFDNPDADVNVFGLSYPSLGAEDRAAVLSVCDRLAAKSVTPDSILSDA